MSIVINVKLDLHALESLIEQFKTGKSLVELSQQSGINKFQIRHALCKTLGDEYWRLACAILSRRRSDAVREQMSKVAKAHNANPEWVEKIIEAKRQQGLFSDLRQERRKAWIKDRHPTRGQGPAAHKHLLQHT